MRIPKLTIIFHSGTLYETKAKLYLKKLNLTDVDDNYSLPFMEMWRKMTHFLHLDLRPHAGSIFNHRTKSIFTLLDEATKMINEREFIYLHNDVLESYVRV